jgi:aminoglycoside 6'-N-acetyltransferase I
MRRDPTVTVDIRALGPGDEAFLINAAVGVFDHSPQKNLTAEFLRDPRHHIVVAIDSGQVVGFVSAVDYVHPDKAAELWINEVGVATTHQNRGVGRLMIEEMLVLGRRLGCRCAWVLTDRANVPAMRLYAASGGIEEAAPSVLFEFHLDIAKQLSPTPKSNDAA